MVTEEQEHPETLEGSLFDKFWSIYPRRVGKGGAQRAFERAVKRAEAEDIVQGALKYRNNPDREDEYTAHPATWLNQDRWLDEDEIFSSVREVELVDLTKRFEDEPEGITFSDWLKNHATPEEVERAHAFSLGRKFP
jgi:hypothetical protein